MFDFAKKISTTFNHVTADTLQTDDVQNSISSLLSTDTIVIKFHEDLFSSFYVKLLTDGQTNAGHYKTSLTKVKCPAAVVRQCASQLVSW